nr:ribosome biogenesis protein NOP53-like [Leptinotarsa decemlineata]
MAITRTKKKKVSKKLKSSWRKHVDVTDVEDFLEDKRLEERLGSITSIPNEELFKIDSDSNLQLLSAKERRKLKANKPLRCFSALQPHTKVSDPIAKRNRVRTKEERRNKLVKLKELENGAKGILKRKEILANANRKLYEERKKNQIRRGEFTEDLWENKDKKNPIEMDEWTTLTTKKHNLRGMGIPVKEVRKSVTEKKSLLPAIEPPHPGMSYNPSYEDHQKLLKLVADKETKLIKEDAHLTRCTKGMFTKTTEKKRDQSWLVEMSEGLPSKDGTNTEENDASDGEYKPVNPPTRNLKKSVKQRRKQTEQLELAKARRALKLEKKKITDIHELKVIMKQLNSNQQKLSILRAKRLQKKELKKNNPKVLSSIKYEEPDLEFNMGNEISGNLKNLRTEGNLLSDRFKSMQKRNILAPTKKHSRKNAKVKKYTKPGHKDEDWKKTVAR